MKEELQLIHQKLDWLLQEVEGLKTSDTIHHNSGFLNLEQAARKLNLSTSRVYALIYEGKLEPLQKGKYSRIQFHPQTIHQYLYGNKQKRTEE